MVLRGCYRRPAIAWKSLTRVRLEGIKNGILQSTGNIRIACTGQCQPKVSQRAVGWRSAGCYPVTGSRTSPSFRGMDGLSITRNIQRRVSSVNRTMISPAKRRASYRRTLRAISDTEEHELAEIKVIHFSFVSLLVCKALAAISPG